MKKKLKLRKRSKYLILIIINLTIFFNIPRLLINLNTIKAFKQNALVVTLIILFNLVYIYKIEK